MTIPAEERGMAAVTHLSGLAGNLVPLGGWIAPIVIWVVKSDSPAISTIAKQALFLNVALLFVYLACLLMAVTVILLPVAIIVGALAGLAGIVLPIVGAVKAGDGTLWRYPLIGSLV